MPDERLLTVTEAADYLRVNPETLRRWLNAGLLRGVQLPSGRRAWRIPESQLERMTRLEEPPTS